MKKIKVMSSKRYKYGELNAAGHPQKGRTLDPSLFSGTDSLTIAAQETRTLRFMKKMTGALKGVVIKVESIQGAGNSWIGSLFNDDEEKPNMVKVRVRIPEIHANLPDPIDYGPAAPPALVALYPVFIAKEENLKVPAPGEVVWVDYGDRENFEDPVYIGPVMNKQYAGAFNTRSDAAPKSVLDSVMGGLGLSAPTGDPIGSSEENAPEKQEPVTRARYKPTGKIGGALVKCTNIQDPVRNGPSCSGYGSSSGDYPLTAPNPGKPDGDFIELGEAQMISWVNRNGRTRLVRADLEATLVAMERDFLKENNLQEGDLQQYINDGYRSFAKQACYYEKYIACVKEWRRQGSPEDQRPSAVATPGPGKHNAGDATDFNRGYAKRKGNALWNWLRKNSTKYGWVWAGKNFSPQEPWHYEFSEELAKKSGLI